MDLGFYYMANAMGRLVGTLLGGFLYFYTVSFCSCRHDVFKPLCCASDYVLRRRRTERGIWVKFSHTTDR